VSNGRTARNRRKRQKRNANRGAVAKASRTSVRRMQKWPSTKDGANFLRAALDPFSDVALRSVGVPDSFAGDTLKHVNTMEVTVMPDSNGRIEFVSLPSASSPLIMRAGTYKAITIPTADATDVPNGTTVIDFDATGHTASNAQLLPALAWPVWAEAYGENGSSIHYGPYAYKSQRVISQGLEWRYTGTELSDQGVCTCAILDSYTIEGYLDKAADPAVMHSANSVAFQRRGDIANLAQTSQTNLSNQPRYVQQTMHTSEGSGGMSVHVASEEGFVLSATDPRTIIIDANLTQAEYTSGVSVPSSLATYGRRSSTTDTTHFPILPWQNLRPIAFAFTGLKTDGQSSIVLRLKQRVEATLTITSAFQQFSDKSPSEDSNAMCIVADVSKGIPVMVPVTMNGFGDWWRKIMSVISSAGKIVGGIGIPMVSQVASGVGGLADILGSFADL